MQFDIAAYLARIGLPESPALDGEGLFALQRAHRLAIPFENLDIPLGRGISLDPAHLFDKLVLRRRGGYCFEQNSVFLSALRALGFEARPLLARVWLFAEDVPPKTHMLLLVTQESGLWIADAGFGGAYAPPMPLAEGEVLGPDGAWHRLVRDDEFGWILERRAGDENEWSRQYSFTTAPVWPSDIGLANHFTATQPGGHFTSNVIASVILPNGLAALTNRNYTRYSASGAERAEIASAKMLQLRLSLVFGIDLSSDEIAALNLF
jgi:N-hydroxyarylamine O-acetyltransferase